MYPRQFAVITRRERRGPGGRDLPTDPAPGHCCITQRSRLIATRAGRSGGLAFRFWRDQRPGYEGWKLRGLYSNDFRGRRVASSTSDSPARISVYTYIYSDTRRVDRTVVFRFPTRLSKLERSFCFRARPRALGRNTSVREIRAFVSVGMHN